MYKFPLLDYEKKLLFILITLPPESKKVIMSLKDVKM